MKKCLVFGYFLVPFLASCQTEKNSTLPGITSDSLTRLLTELGAPREERVEEQRGGINDVSGKFANSRQMVYNFKERSLNTDHSSSIYELQKAYMVKTIPQSIFIFRPSVKWEGLLGSSDFSVEILNMSDLKFQLIKIKCQFLDRVGKVIEERENSFYDVKPQELRAGSFGPNRHAYRIKYKVSIVTSNDLENIAGQSTIEY